MEERNVDSWNEFERELIALRQQRQANQSLLDSSLLFRGQENSGWLLETTLDRKQERMLFKDYYRIIDRIRPQIETLADSKWPIPKYPVVENWVADYDTFSIKIWSGRCPGYAYMAYLRHHGFPSPLLDWTRSP